MTMPSRLTFGNYVAAVDFDEEIGRFHGRFINIRDVVNFYGASVRDLEEEGRRSLDVYIAFSREQGLTPG